MSPSPPPDRQSVDKRAGVLSALMRTFTFDPPRRLVIRGPYRFARNPMYLGAGAALAGVALYFGSRAMLAYAGLFLFVAHLSVGAYEEPGLRRRFGPEYEAYCDRVRRWIPQLRAAPPSAEPDG